MTDRDREIELERLRAELASRRAEWVPRVAPKARASKSPAGWHLGDISGTAGDSLLIYADREHRTHVDFNGERWKGDDLDLIRALCRLPDFPSTVEHAAGLIGFQLKARAKGGADERRDWPILMPAPKSAGDPPAPKPRGAERHEARHCYRDRDGRILFYVDRFREPGSGAKRFCPLTWRHPPRQPDRGEWVPYAPTGKLPLYGLDRLRGAEAVLLVEGERTADIAQHIAPAGYAALTFSGGTSRTKDADYGPLAGLPVTGWPDHDVAGQSAMATALHCAATAGAKVCGMIAVPAEWPARWDLADPWPEPGADPEARVCELIDAAVPVEAPGADRSEGAADGAAPGLGVWDAGEDDYNIPPRAWLLGTTFCRGFLSSLIGAGAVGKTSVRIAQLLSLATGRSLTGEHVHHRARVLLLSLEDGRDELRRRVRAAMLHHAIVPADIKGWLFLGTPKNLRLAEMRDGSHRIGALEAELRRTIAKRGIDLVSLDPFVKAHSMPENDNAAIDFVCSVLLSLATELDIAADAPHHVRKGPAAAGDANTGRGASAFKDAGRLVYTLTTMTPDEAKDLGVSEAERRRLVRLDSGKVNLAPPALDAVWFKLVGVKLGNATTAYPNGDEVQTVEPWTPPDLWRVINTFVANEILDKIEAGRSDGGRYSDAPAATIERSAWRVVKEATPDLTEEQCRKVIATWLKKGVLRKNNYRDPIDRKNRVGLFVVAAKRPGTRNE